jgi:hypothetical protein
MLADEVTPNMESNSELVGNTMYSSPINS